VAWLVHLHPNAMAIYRETKDESGCNLVSRSTIHRAKLMAVVVSFAACGGYRSTPLSDPDAGGHGDCLDADGDGYGEGTDCDGSDCNDAVPAVHAESECEALCAAGPAPGCPCDALEPTVCYGGSPETIGIGDCVSGLSTCVGGVWGPCLGEVVPAEETCNGIDDDCDGTSDEGVANACGDCARDCIEECVGVGCPEGFDEERANDAGIAVSPEGGLTLDASTMVRHRLIWIANSTEGTVSKIDTEEREEVARYDTGPGGPWIDSPSRTTVNFAGDVVVANRGTIGEATKYYGEDCPDMDGDGRIETSSGPTDVFPWQDDECYAWSTPIGSGARGSGFELRTGLDGHIEEYVWVGSTSLGVIKELDSETGELTGRELSGVYPYGLAIGPDNRVWTFNGWGGGVSGLIEVTTTDEGLETTLHPYPAGISQYGITVDSRGRVWVSSFGTAARYDPVEDEWEQAVGTGGGGIAVDGNDDAWLGEADAAGWGATGPFRIDGETLEVTSLDVDPEVGGHGWAVDFDGFVWCVPWSGTNAYVIDPDTLEEVAEVDGLVGAYTYSDMTGFQLANAAKPVGTFTIDFEGCADEVVRWASLSWDADVPEDTSIRFAVRTANDFGAELDSAPRVDVASAPSDASPASIADALDATGIEPRHVLRLEVTLATESGDAAPLLRSITVQKSCGE
jgi:DNA-binding beta-propeller fold protein YncE